MASIDTETGDTTLFSLPRNLEDLPFPEDSPLAEVYPDGFWAGSESESLLNAVYRNGPAEYPDILGPTDNPGADFLKLGVGEALGLTIDYYVLVNLDGFSQLVDALGGITVNVNYYVPDRRRPGHRVAARRLHRARARTSSMDGAARAALRPRPVRAHRLRPHGPPALHDQRDHRRRRPGDPAARGTRRSPRPRRTSSAPTSRSAALDDFVDLALLVKDAEHPERRLRRHGDPPGLSGLRPDARRSSRTRWTRRRAAPTDDAAGDAADVAAAEPTAGHRVRRPRPAEDPVADVADACAYDPAQAEEALAAGRAADQRRLTRAAQRAGDLDQVAAGVVEDGGGDRAHRRRLLGERDAERRQPVELACTSSTAKDVNGMPSATSAALNGPAAGWSSGSSSSSTPSGSSGETTVSQRCSPIGTSCLLHEAEHVGVEAQRLLLVVDEDAGQVDPHGGSSSGVGRPPLGDGRSGVVSRSWNL